SLRSVINEINGISDVGSNHTQPTHPCHLLNTHQLSAWKSATAARPWHREPLFMPLCRHSSPLVAAVPSRVQSCRSFPADSCPRCARSRDSRPFSVSVTVELPLTVRLCRN